MFETIIALFIQRYIARYFDLNADQLSAQLFYQRQITIENLTLNQTTFNEDLRKKFRWPIEIQSFIIRKIQCSFILSSLLFQSSSPALIIKIEGVHAILTSIPLDEDSFFRPSTNNDDENPTTKQNQLNLAEQQLEKEFECFGEVKSSRWNVQRLLTSFLEKVQIDIVDVHINYQSTTFYSIGFTCQSIQISNQSSDENLSQQVLQVINPGLYIDTNSSSNHCYILSPTTSMEISLIHNHFLVRQKEYRYELECSLANLSMNCTIEQVRILAEMIHSIQQSSLQHMLLSDANRPRLKISKQSVKAWWHYAVLTVLRIHTTSSSSFWFDRTRCMNRLHRLIIYQRLYRLYVENKYFQSENFSLEDTLTMKDIEQEFDIAHLLIIRRSIFQKRINEHQSMQKKQTTRWYSTYAKWITDKMIDLWGKIPTTEEMNTTLNENDLKVQEQVNSFIADSLEDEDLSENCQNALIIRLKFLLQSIEINLLSSDNQLLFCFDLKNLLAFTEFRQRNRSILMSISLGDLCIRDQEQVDEFAKIISSKESSQQIPILEFSLEKKGRSRISKQSVYSIDIRSCGLCFTCSPTTMERLHNVYSLTFGSSTTQSVFSSIRNWRKIKGYAIRNTISIWERLVSSSTMLHRHRERKKYLIHMNMGAPKIVIPLSSQGALIVDLGCVTLTNDAIVQQRVNEEEEEEEFLTPDSSPLANDSPLEEETFYYSMNIIPNDEIQYSTVTLTVCDIQVGYSVDCSQIVENFNVQFQLQHSLDHFWPLTSISGSIQKLSVHFNPQVIQTVNQSIQSWVGFVNNLLTQYHSQSSSSPKLNFSLDEITIRLNDTTQTLCDIRLQNIDLSWRIDHPVRKLILTLPTLTFSDYLLKTDSTIIGIIADLSSQQRQLIADINIDKLNFIFNLKLVCALINLFSNIKLFSWNESGCLNCRIKTTFRQLHLSVVDITSMQYSTELRLQTLVLNILTNPFLVCEMTMIALDIANVLSIGQKVSPHAALSFSLKTMPNKTRQLSLKMTTASLNPSLTIIQTAQQIFDYLSQNCPSIRSSQADLIHSPLTMDIDTLNIVLPAGVALQLTPVRISNSPMRTSIYTVNIDRMDMISDLSQGTPWPLLENIHLSLKLQISSSVINIHLQVLSPLRIYLSQHRIKTLRQILDASSINTTSSLPSIAFHLHCPQMTLTLQTDHVDHMTTLCELALNYCQMTLESNQSHSQKIALRFNSLQINESLLTLTSLELIGDSHEQININLDKINIQFVQLTWTILIEIIAMINNAKIAERKHQPTHVSINMNSVACLFRTDRTPVMSIDVQHITGQLIASTIEGRLDSISLHDLTMIDQPYSERLRVEAATFTMLAHSKINLRLTSIQYIHTQDFLGHLIDYFHHCRSSMNKSDLFQISRGFNKTHLDIDMENITFILPEQISRTPILVFQLSRLHYQKQLELGISIEIKDLELFSSSLTNTTNKSMITREPFHLTMTIEPKQPTYVIKINLSTIDLLFDVNLYRSIENIFIYNLNNRSNSLPVLKDWMSIELACIIETERVGLEIFLLEHHRSIAYATLTNLHLSLDRFTNGNQIAHLLCSTLTLIDTRVQQKSMILPLSISSDTAQLELHLSRNKTDLQCAMTLNSIRFLFVIDWLLTFNEFLNPFCDGSNRTGIRLPGLPTDIKLNFNRLQVVLVSSTENPYSSALVYSSTMMINYGKENQPIECHLTDFSFSTCQIGNIDETAVPIIEPTDCLLIIRSIAESSQEQTCHMNIPTLNMRLSYSDVHMLYSLIQSIHKRISEAKTRKPLLTLFSSVLTSPVRTLRSSAMRFLNIQSLKLISDEMCLCLIDDCSGVNIPLLNIHLKPFLLHNIENSPTNRTDQAQLDVTISYYNRFQSGFEPLIEHCPLLLTLTRSTSTTSLYISANDILHLNFTKAMYRLIGTVKTNWLADCRNTKKPTGYRLVKPLDPYCFQNLLGVQVKFRTWSSTQQSFSMFENIVNHHHTVSFSFLSKSSLELNIRRGSISLVTSLFQSNRRLSISINGWETLQPISIDRIGTFFRLAIPSANESLYKPMLVMIDIAMTDSTIRLITIRSAIEIRNRLRTSVDLRLISHEDSPYEFCLEPNESRSVPLQLCSTLRELQLRPANFALDYCDEPIHWSAIEKNAAIKEKAEIQQSFLRSCSISGKDAVYYACLQAKQTCLVTHANQSFSVYQLTILPPLTICNLLPCALTFQIPMHPQKFELAAYQTHREHTVSIGETFDILFATSLYGMRQPLHLPTNNDLNQRVIFYDHQQRELFVDVLVECNIEHRLKISVSVPYIFMNKSGIPLIFKDGNGKVEAAGQSADDEIVVNREPLLFSFENATRNNACMMRVGTGFHRHQDGQPQWSQRFEIKHGSTHQQLQVRSSTRATSHWNYSIAIDVRPGRGSLKDINFVFLSARYVIFNQCSYNLLITQRSLKDDPSNYLHVFKQATVAYHWPRTDMEKFLCVRAMNDHHEEIVHWSGGFPIDSAQALHFSMRYTDGQCLILRVQVIKRNGTFFIIFMDSNEMPPPFRMTNRSDVPILFYQSEVQEELTYLRTIIQPHQSMDYAWDEPTLKPLITCSTPDGTKEVYDPLKLGDADDLSFQNYIYLAFQDTFPETNLMQFSSHTDKSLVIEYSNNRVILTEQQKSKRSQLWQMTDNGLLIHIDSSPSSAQTNYRQALVLDLEDIKETSLSGLSGRFSPLTVKRYDPKRTLTQTWQWLDNGYLCLANTQLCVQVFGELKKNTNAVLGSIIKNHSQSPLPTMHIRSHSQYPGSGLLSVRVIADGPINVLEIDHKKNKESTTRSAILPPSSTIYHLDLHFPAGVGISVVGSIGHEAEELLYVLVNNLQIEYDDKDRERSIDARIESLMISNQLLTTTKPCFFHATYTEDSPVTSAIRLQINWQKFDNNFTLMHIIHSLYLYINSISIQMEEILLWKLIDFFDVEISSLSSFLYNAIGKGKHNNTDHRMDLNVRDYETERLLSLLTSTQATRIYFHKLYLSAIDLNLSISCIPSKRCLPPHLQAIRQRASLPLVPFENAQINLKSYEQTHISNTYDCFLLSILTHYIHVGKRQAYKIVGTVDYLGNPLGLFHDVTDGLTCLADERGVSGLVKNVAHGVADSTSKVTGSLSHGIGKLVPDRDRRTSTTDSPRNSTVGHAIRHGTTSLASGFYGGLTSMIKQPYKGVVEDGVSGLVKGFAKGIVGTVSKPVVGILDFTNEMATVIKEGARPSNSLVENRLRLPRCPCNTLGLLQSYSSFDAQGHFLLYKINKGNSSERYISRLTLSTINNARHINAMITTERVIFYRIDESNLDDYEILNSFDFHTPVVVVPTQHPHGSASIEIILHSNSSIYSCDTFEQASLIHREVQRAQDLFQEEKLIYNSSSSNNQFDESEE